MRGTSSKQYGAKRGKRFPGDGPGCVDRRSRVGQKAPEAPECGENGVDGWPEAVCKLPRCSNSERGTEDRSEIHGGEQDDVAFVGIDDAAEPSSSPTSTLAGVSEAAFDTLAAQFL